MSLINIIQQLVAHYTSGANDHIVQLYTTNRNHLLLSCPASRRQLISIIQLLLTPL
jgi:hypothetical protein